MESQENASHDGNSSWRATGEPREERNSPKSSGVAPAEAALLVHRPWARRFGTQVREACGVWVKFACEALGSEVGNEVQLQLGWAVTVQYGGAVLATASRVLARETRAIGGMPWCSSTPWCCTHLACPPLTSWPISHLLPSPVQFVALFKKNLLVNWRNLRATVLRLLAPL